MYYTAIERDPRRAHVGGFSDLTAVLFGLEERLQSLSAPSLTSIPSPVSVLVGQ